MDVRQVGNLAPLFDDLDLRAVHIERAPAQRFGENEAEAVDVRFGRDRAAGKAELLRRHVIVFAGKSVADDRALARPLRPGDAKIDDLGAVRIAVRQNDIVGGDVPMDDAKTMRRLKRAADALLQDFYLRQRHGTLGQAFRQRRAVDEFHRQISALQIRIERKHEITNDGFVLKIVQRRGLAPEQGESLGIARQLRQDHLDRDGIVGLDVEALVDLAHPALRDQRLDLIDAIEPNAAANRTLWRRLNDRSVFHGLAAPPRAVAPRR